MDSSTDLFECVMIWADLTDLHSAMRVPGPAQPYVYCYVFFVPLPEVRPAPSRLADSWSITSRILCEPQTLLRKRYSSTISSKHSCEGPAPGAAILHLEPSSRVSKWGMRTPFEP